MLKLLKLSLLCSIFCIGNIIQAQTNVTGKVLSDENNESLIGVSVIALPSGNGTLTDIDGTYSINLGTNDSIRFVYLGFKPLTIAINGRTQIDVTLFEDVQLVDEVVIIGYGKVKKSDLTGAVSSVKAEVLNKVPTSNPIQALQGQVSGLNVSTTSGDPGATPVVRLRGVTTLNDNNPIVVIDGVISDVSAMNSLNANDVESIEVLKDASSTAIYGSRGAAGVIIVTTKIGRSDKNTTNISIDQSFESISNKIGVMTGREFATYVNEINPGTYNNLDILPDVNWQDLIYQDFAPITNANLSVGGSTDKANYYLGLGYFGQEGIIPKSRLDRFTAKINSSLNIVDNFRIGLNLTLGGSSKDNAPGIVANALRAWPINEPYNMNGSFAEVNGGNPLATLEYTNSTTSGLKGIGNLFAEWTFLKNFTLKTSGQIDFGTAKTRSFTPQFFVAPLQQNETSDFNINYGNNQRLIWENTLNYNNSFGVHAFDFLAGYSVQQEDSEFLTASTQNLLREDPLFWYIDGGQAEFETAGNNYFKNTLISYLGRVNYSYDSRYLFTATLRRDGSSKFGINNRYGNFPSLAIGWNVTNERFFPDNSILSNLKVRASWGIIGNERINGNAQYSTISPGVDAVYGDGSSETIYPGVAFSTGGNPDLKWEDTEQTDIGFEIGLFNNRIIGEFDFYRKNTSDILVQLFPIGYLGIGSFKSITYNAANVVNTGFEWNVSYRSDASKDFKYQIGILGSTVNNEVVSLGEDFGASDFIVAGNLGNGQNVSRTSIGEPIGYFYGYDVVGVFQNDQELESSPTLTGQEVGDLKYRDVDGDGKITSTDRTRIGQSIPSLTYGLNLRFEYKNLSLSAVIQGQAGNDIYNGKQAIQFALLNYEDKFNNRWTGEGSTNEHFKASQGGSNFFPSSYFVEDGSFTRLRNVTLAYDFGSEQLRRLKLATAQIYIRGTNLYTLTKFSGFSPDLGAANPLSGVIDLGSYPITRALSVGLRFSI